MHVRESKQAMDTEEMFRRGAADAERGAPHPFYYQHYYPYRRGYDQARRRLRRPLPWRGGWSRRWALIFVFVVAAIGAVTLIYRDYFQADTLAQIQPTATSTATPTPTRRPLYPTATPLPTPTPIVMQTGGVAVVSNLQGSVLNARQEPSLSSPRVARFQPDEQVRILEGPVDADGLIWWRIEGADGVGWSVERSPEGVVWLQPVVVQ
jgi:hypothetical protein